MRVRSERRICCIVAGLQCSAQPRAGPDQFYVTGDWRLCALEVMFVAKAFVFSGLGEAPTE
jgi:hypothetical protein